MTSTVTPPDLADVAGRFTARLRSAGLPVSPEQAGRFAASIALARPLRTDEMYWLGRVTLTTERAEVASFDAVFADVFRGLVDVADFRGERNHPQVPSWMQRGKPRSTTPQDREASEVARSERPATPAAASDGGDRDSQRDRETPQTESVMPARASDIEVLRKRPFATCTPEELAQLRALLAQLRVITPLRLGRRQRRHRLGGSIDQRRTVRQARRTAGHPYHLARRHPDQRRRRVVMVADVSGSMAAYSRAYLYLMHGAARAWQTETFLFATQLTRVTRALSVSSPERALARASANAADWSGGTRIGSALQAFNDGWGRRGLARGAIVVIVSDGWESGDPANLGEQMARLSRLAHRVIWVNPRSQADDYQPLTGGMAAALPHVDRLLSGHTLAALESVLAAIAD